MLHSASCDNLLANENGMARLRLLEALSGAGVGHARVRDPWHADGDRFSGCDEVDHRRRRAPASSGKIIAAGADRVCRVFASARLQYAAHYFEQHFRATRDLRFAERFFFALSTAAAAMVRQ